MTILFFQCFGYLLLMHDRHFGRIGCPKRINGRQVPSWVAPDSSRFPHFPQNTAPMATTRTLAASYSHLLRVCARQVALCFYLLLWRDEA